MIDIIERMKETLRLVLSKRQKYTAVTYISDSDWNVIASVLAEAEKLGESVLYPAAPAKNEWPGRGTYLVIPVLDPPKEPT
jgi:hypothetical protein